MLRATLHLGAVSGAFGSWLCLPIELGRSVTSQPANMPLCLGPDSFTSSAGSLTVTFETSSHDRFCVAAEVVGGVMYGYNRATGTRYGYGQPFVAQSQKAHLLCGIGSLSLPLPSLYNTPYWYVAMIETASQHVTISASAAVTRNAPPSPDTASPPSPTSPPEDDCEIDECDEDIERWCPHDRDKLSCLELNKARISPECAEAIDHIPPRCLSSPYYWPMAIASMLLLATASVVLLCTLLRCCCRYVCHVQTHPVDDTSFLEDVLENSDDEGSIGSVTPLPSGVKMQEVSINREVQLEEKSDEDESELPAYTEVVEGAAIRRLD